TSAGSSSVAEVPSSSSTTAVKMLVWMPSVAPGGTANAASNVQNSVGSSSVPTLQSASPASTPNLSSIRLVIVADTGPLFVTTYVKVTLPPVSGTVVGLAVFSTMMLGSTSLYVTVAGSSSVTSLPSSSSALAVNVLMWVPPAPLPGTRNTASNV